MDVETAQRREVKYRFGQQLAVSRDDYGVWLETRQLSKHLVRPEVGWLNDGQSVVDRVVLDL
jgi:hypothetical protein